MSEPWPPSANALDQELSDFLVLTPTGEDSLSATFTARDLKWNRKLPIRATEVESLRIGDRVLYDYRIHVYDFERLAENRRSGTPHEGVIGTDLREALGAIFNHGSKRLILPVDR